MYLRLEIAFLSKSLRSLCSEERLAIKELGEIVATRLKRRLADIRAAENVHELLIGNPRTLGNTYIVDLHDDSKIIFCANHNNNPLTETGEINWLKVSRIKIIKLGYYNVK